VSETNPIIESNLKRPRSSTGRGSKLFYLNLDASDNPFVEQIADNDRLKRLFQQYPFIPYNGSNQNPEHTLLYVLDVLGKLSPTQSSVINSMGFYCYGGKINIVESVDTEFSLEQNEITESAARQDYQNLMLIKPVIGFRETAKRLFRSRKVCGEHYLRIDYYQIAGVKKCVLSYVDHKNILPVITEDGKPETFITFDEFNSDTLQQKKYEVIGKYPYITENKKGLSTIVQYKNGIGKRGRPNETGILIDQYREYKDNVFLTRQSANNFTPQIIMEQEEADPEQTANEEIAAVEAGFDNQLQRIIANFTNGGDSPSPIFMTNRPFGTRESLIHEVSQNTREKWFVETGNITRKRIIDAHGWSERLIGDSDVGSGMFATAILETLKIKLPLINAETSIEEQTLNTAIDSAFNWLGVDFEGRDINFNNPYKTLLDQTQTQ
jgi:hypothetical protein